MIRVQVRLTEEEYAAAKAEARRLGVSLSELLRRSRWQGLPVDTSMPWMRFAGMVESGNPESSRTIDEVIDGDS